MKTLEVRNITYALINKPNARMTKRSVSLVSTILNDLSGARALIADLREQTRAPDEFVVVDGGSRDGTWEYLNEQAAQVPFSLRLIREVGANVSRGRNLAIEHASHEIILSTDFGCRLDRNWVEELARPFDEDAEVEIVTGSWTVPSEEIVTPAQWAEYALAGGKLGLTATPRCLASTRSIAFRRPVWEQFGRYPEDLTLAGDDAIFALWMVSSGRKIAAAPRAMCYWHRFPTMKGYWREARRNFRGAGEAIFFLSYGVRAGILALLEFLSLVVAVGGIAFYLGGMLALTWVCLMVGALMLVWSRRVRRWIGAARLLWNASKLHYSPWIPVLDVGVRIQSVVGYWEGFFVGFSRCTECRTRMRELSVRRW